MRCFHCGNGLRNWESEDIPWEEHARWYPDCHYVILCRGRDFVDEVRRKRPIYFRSAAFEDNESPQRVTAPSSGCFNPVNDSDLEILMESDVIKQVISTGFNPDIVRAALRRKLRRTGLPFFRFEECVDTWGVLEQQREKEEEDKKKKKEEEKEKEEEEATMHYRNSAAAADTIPTPEPVVSSSPDALTPRPSASVSSSAMEIEQLETGNGSGYIIRMDGENEVDEEEEETEVSVATIPPTPGCEKCTKIAATAAADTIPTPEPVVSSSPGVDVSTPSGDPSDALTPPPLAFVSSSGAASTSGSSAMETEQLESQRIGSGCVICMDGKNEVVFLPCAHMVSCSICAAAISQCPVCRRDIEFIIKPITP